MNQNPCETCAYASWMKTKNNRNHPSGQGRCLWSSGEFVMAKSVNHFDRIKLPVVGGFISRGTKYASHVAPCPTWKVKS